jgi:hypothetical protein
MPILVFYENRYLKKIDLMISPSACIYKYIVYFFTAQACVHLLSLIHFASQVDYQLFPKAQHGRSFFCMVEDSME